MEACVSDRRIISFNVPRSTDAEEPTEWLRSDATWGPDRGQALRLTMYARPTPMERPRIEAVTADALGGLDKLLEQQQQLRLLNEVVRAEVHQEVVATFWPDGLPETAEGSEERAAQQGLIQEASEQLWQTHRSPAMVQLLAVSRSQSFVEFLGQWAVLQRGAPPAWRDLGSRDDLGLEQLYAIVRAWELAAEEFARGNAPASA